MGSRRPGSPTPGRRPLPQHLPAEAKQLGRPAAGAGVDPTGPLDEPGLLDQPAEVLLVEADPREGLDDALELEQGEVGGSSSKTTGRYLQLAAQPASAVARMRRWSAIGARRRPRVRPRPGTSSGLAAIARALRRRGRPRREARSVRGRARHPRARRRDRTAISARSRRGRRASAPPAQLASAGEIASSITAGRPPRQSSHGKKS